MNNTIIKENEIDKDKEMIIELNKRMHQKDVTFDLITELSSLENDYTDKIKENENKILKIIYKYI